LFLTKYSTNKLIGSNTTYAFKQPWARLALLLSKCDPQSISQTWNKNTRNLTNYYFICIHAKMSIRNRLFYWQHNIPFVPKYTEVPVHIEINFILLGKWNTKILCVHFILLRIYYKTNTKTYKERLVSNFLQFIQIFLD